MLRYYAMPVATAPPALQPVAVAPGSRLLRLDIFRELRQDILACRLPPGRSCARRSSPSASP